ncbi:CoA transferase [Gordonia westfalica]|uniref:CoA transferase n=1 Tax=Gordonia westfalica TaxID=158898 RepID=A0ABU2GU32_9ACTN|nr:CoA transferase [Gordonia westfalica]MDS1114967.1 CoA transferase [Gordonia westfalica]
MFVHPRLESLVRRFHRVVGPPGTNSIDSGAPFYNVYRTSDDAFMAVGAIEPHFYTRLLRGLGLADDLADTQHDRTTWPTTKALFADTVATRSRDDWTAIFAPLDACVTPVLTLDEAPQSPQMSARGTLVAVNGHVEPAPAPRYSTARANRASGSMHSNRASRPPT